MSLICGIDEAGRGCVAGSLFLACVILDTTHFESFLEIGIKDSKKLTQKKRSHIATLIKDFLRLNMGYEKIVRFDSKIIDNKGISYCMQSGLEQIFSYAKAKKCQMVVFDGNTNFGIKGIETIVNGDNKHVLIGAASILAKYSKDSEMEKEHKNYPYFNFKENKGYLTKKHLESIVKYGYTPIHRKSYRIKALESSLF